jgi:hypothetical protein
VVASGIAGVEPVVHLVERLLDASVVAVDAVALTARVVVRCDAREQRVPVDEGRIVGRRRGRGEQQHGQRGHDCAGASHGG